MIGRADIEGSKSNVAMNAWLPQASYPCGNFSDTSKGSIGHAFTMCRPSQTPHLTMSSARINPPKRVLGLKEGVITPPPIHGSFHKVGLESSSTGSSFPADSANPVPLAVVSLDSRQGQDHRNALFYLNSRIPLVRTSSELAVRHPRKAPERAVPCPSPGRHEAVRSRHVSGSSSLPTVDGFGTVVLIDQHPLWVLVSLWASTRVSSGFTLLRHSSPSFGSRQACSRSNPSQKIKVGRLCTREESSQSASLRLTGYSPIDSHTCQTPWSVFQDGTTGEPTGRRLEHADAEARREARAADHNQGSNVSAGVTKART
ncbi:hypothetical protein YC2023_066021 [Brassica napus]